VHGIRSSSSVLAFFIQHSGRNDLKNAKLIVHHHAITIPPKFHQFLTEKEYCLVKNSKIVVKIVVFRQIFNFGPEILVKKKLAKNDGKFYFIN
jgi:hypothetical protein